MPEYPPRGYPPTESQRHMVPAGIARQARHAARVPLDTGPLGDTRSQGDSFLDHPDLRDYTPVPAYYVVQVELGPEPGDNAPGQTQLRPEPFVLQRITWSTNGDLALPPGVGLFPFWGVSQQGRSVEITWGDTFTKFLGTNSSLISALFGDSNGFLDLPGVALFQGSQNLQVVLNRLFWPFQLGEGNFLQNPRNVRFDFVFEGVGLLPKGVNQSGSVG